MLVSKLYSREESGTLKRMTDESNNISNLELKELTIVLSQADITATYVIHKGVKINRNANKKEIFTNEIS